MYANSLKATRKRWRCCFNLLRYDSLLCKFIFSFSDAFVKTAKIGNNENSGLRAEHSYKSKQYLRTTGRPAAGYTMLIYPLPFTWTHRQICHRYIPVSLPPPPESGDRDGFPVNAPPGHVTRFHSHVTSAPPCCRKPSAAPRSLSD